VSAGTRLALRWTRLHDRNQSNTRKLSHGTRLAIALGIMIWIALLPSLIAGWLFVGTLRLRGAKAR